MNQEKMTKEKAKYNLERLQTKIDGVVFELFKRYDWRKKVTKQEYFELKIKLEELLK